MARLTSITHPAEFPCLQGRVSDPPSIEMNTHPGGFKTRPYKKWSKKYHELQEFVQSAPAGLNTGIALTK